LTFKEQEREAKALARHLCGVLKCKPTNGQYDELVHVLMARTTPRKKVDYTLTKTR
jgi:hypothetical protein